ncbi:hypothetical protein C2E20_5830 [Micractinium conductrix]|uniref:HAUS augmin-like complex subunit 6 N-terminal domain-containing protein n=1 Tax=Micractinium conductrix TaxID=554055 RepID=A0A2P6V9P5_9CHLO|nr:hypothetical protein C2E20_5830 [Micractinium conductrix]|eukprot:PSC70806.1 hypothetical protein C2E20_5830 [Micractinium conductrix]
MAERQRRQQAESAAVLHAALAYLNRGNVCREPLTPGMFARPNLKGLQAALYLLHHRIRGAARTKKEFQHVYPVLEPSQAKEFKAAMQGWVRELGAAGMVHPDTVRFFVSAYLGSSGGHRTVFMLLDISLVALAKELGSEAPQASLPGAADVLAPAAATATLQHDRAANAAAAAARRAGQGRLDSVVAAMQRVKQLHVQAAGQLAGSTAASGGEAAQLAPRVPPLFVGSQAASRRGDLFQELLAQGPPVTAKPEAVGPDSWADLVSAGRGGGGGAAAAAATMPAFGTPPAAARRLSNPAQEASNFAAKGLAADADVHTVHSVLVARLEAAAAAIQGLTSAGAATGASTDSAEVRAALAEAAAYREAFMLSARHDLAAAQLRVELQAASGAQPSLLQLLPPSLPPTNPVLEGMAAAQEAAAAGTSEADNSWAVPDDALVQALRRSMWQQALSGAGSSNQRPHASAAVAAELEARERAPPAAAAAAADPGSPLRHQPLATEGSCGSSQATRARAAVAFDSPSLADLLSNCTKGLAALPLLSGDATVEALASPAAAAPQDQNREQQSWAPSYMQRQRGQPDQQLPASPCMAESCASVSVVAENHSIHSSLAAAPAGQQKPGRGGNAAAGGGRLGSSSAAADGAAAGFDMDALRQRLAKMRMKG